MRWKQRRTGPEGRGRAAAKGRARPGPQGRHAQKQTAEVRTRAKQSPQGRALQGREGTALALHFRDRITWKYQKTLRCREHPHASIPVRRTSNHHHNSESQQKQSRAPGTKPARPGTGCQGKTQQEREEPQGPRRHRNLTGVGPRPHSGESPSLGVMERPQLNVRAGRRGAPGLLPPPPDRRKQEAKTELFHGTSSRAPSQRGLAPILNTRSTPTPRGPKRGRPGLG